jgi:peptidoglycan/xylan/chitin deacetylase (PgdA/CDA1 family)
VTRTHLFKRGLAWTLLRSGALGLGSRLARRRAVLLLYHRVNDSADPFFPALPLRVFTAQLDYLSSRYPVRPLEEVVGWLAAGAPGPPRLAITIDDGYPDTHDVVLPELARRGLPATLLLSTGPPETGEPLWVDRIRWAFKHARTGVVEAGSLGLHAPVVSEADRLSVLSGLLRRLKALGPRQIDEALREVSESLDPDGPALRVLNWEEVRRMAAGPIRIGAHTHRHYLLSRLDDATLLDELETSVRLIGERTAARPTTFAYPNGEAGDYDARSSAVLRELGIECALTSRHGLARPEHDRFELPRLYTSEPHLPLFAARLTGLAWATRP